LEACGKKHMNDYRHDKFKLNTLDISGDETKEKKYASSSIREFESCPLACTIHIPTLL
jgi:hypothetical protein